MPRHRDPFIPLVAEDRLNRHFRKIRDSPGYYPARRIITEVLQTFDDSDGNFIEQLQTTGFDARIWELYLHEYLRSSGMDVRRGKPSPDFIATSAEHVVCIEAVTVNPTEGASRIEPLADPTREPDIANVVDSAENRLPIKLASALYSKLQRRYWELPAVEGRPLLIAIEAFHEAGSLAYSNAALSSYVYGAGTQWWYDAEGILHVDPRPIEAHRSGTKEIPSGFFNLPGAEFVSAVLFSNSGTIAKFNRMGHQGPHPAPPEVHIFRGGTCFDPDPNSVLPGRFFYEVGTGQHIESWGEGVVIMHNPRARYPAPRGSFFPDAVHLQTDERGVPYALYPVESRLIPLSSLTFILMEREDGDPIAKDQVGPKPG